MADSLDHKHPPLSISSGGTNSGIAALAKAVAHPMLLDDVRQARIAELRKQYMAGEYTIDAARLSAKMVDEHIE